MTPALAAAARGPVAGIATEAVPCCPACGSDRRHLRTHITEHEYTTTTTDAFPLMACEGCGAWYLDPRPHVSALGVIYPPDYYAYAREALAASKEPAATGLFARLASALFKRRIRPIAKYIPLGPAMRLPEASSATWHHVTITRGARSGVRWFTGVSSARLRFSRSEWIG